MEFTNDLFADEVMQASAFALLKATKPEVFSDCENIFDCIPILLKTDAGGLGLEGSILELPTVLTDLSSQQQQQLIDDWLEQVPDELADRLTLEQQDSIGQFIVGLLQGKGVRGKGKRRNGHRRTISRFHIGGEIDREVEVKSFSEMLVKLVGVVVHSLEERSDCLFELSFITNDPDVPTGKWHPISSCPVMIVNTHASSDELVKRARKVLAHAGLDPESLTIHP